MTPRILHRAATAFAAIALGHGAAQAQQQTPPPPSPPAAAARPAAAAVAVSPAVMAAAVKKHRAGVVQGLQLSSVQQDRLFANLQQQGWTPPAVMQQSFQVPPPSALAAGDCPSYMAAWRKDLDGARAGLARLVAINNPGDVPAFEQNIPKDCAYRELAYYLGVLGRFGAAEPAQ